MNGKGLEWFIYELYKDLGYTEVIRDYRVSKSNGGEKARGQIDLTYKRFFIKRYVECKYRNGNNVDFNDYSKFETTLKTFNIPTYLGEMVTNSYFDEKVRLRAKESRIKLIDMDELIRLNDSRKSLINSILLTYRSIEIFEQKGLKKALEYFTVRKMNIENQIKYYEKYSSISPEC
ncbi:MAG: restriction endonuclease [Candidatus Woesearchaeota archaeon]